jgi:hypothetical protein
VTGTADDPPAGQADIAPAAAPPAAAPPVNVTALFAEAASKSAVMWVQAPGDRPWPFWHAWADGTVYAVSGPGEQPLPWLPEEADLVLRSKDTGGRLLAVRATVREIGPQDPQWGPATEALKASRLNATDDLEARWRTDCTVRAFRPFGAPLEAPGSYRHTSGAAPAPPTPATTTHWRPWHWRGRPRRRRGNRLPDDP